MTLREDFSMFPCLCLPVCFTGAVEVNSMRRHCLCRCFADDVDGRGRVIVALETVGVAMGGLLIVSAAIFLVIFALRLYSRRSITVKQKMQRGNHGDDASTPHQPPPLPLLSLPCDGV